MRFTVYRTDKGSLDKGGLPQPSFLNFDAKLLFPPAHALQVRRVWLSSARRNCKPLNCIISLSHMFQTIQAWDVKQSLGCSCAETSCVPYTG